MLFDALSIINDMLLKADPGEEPGEFRGGDPEELQRKREEKRQEMEDSGQLEEQEAEEEMADPAAIEEAEEQEKQKLEDAGKSIIQKAGEILARQISPVDTFGDYFPRDANGDPIANKLHQVSDKYKPPGPVRAGENQQKVWSEVLGAKIPLTGSPVQHLRRYTKQGKFDEAAEEREKLIRSGILWCRSLEFNELSKGVGDAPKPFHKYVKRWWENNQWNYDYNDKPHHSKHGMSHVGNFGGHTIDVHEEFGKHHKHEGNAEKAYQYSLLRYIADGGSHPIRVYNKDTNSFEDKVAHFPGVGGKKGIIKHDKDKMPVISGRRAVRIRDPHHKELHGDPEGEKLQTPKAFVNMMHRSHVTTEHDVDGNPWIHWRPSGGKGSSQPYYMFDSASRFSPKDSPYYGKMDQGGFKNIDTLRDFVESHTGDDGHQRRIKEEEDRVAYSPDERKIAKDWEPTYYKDARGEKVEKKITNQLERGELGTWEMRPISIDVHKLDTDGNLHVTGTRFKNAWQFNFDDSEERSKILFQLLIENRKEMETAAKRVLVANHLWTNDKHEMATRVNDLVNESFSRSFEHAVNSYNPKNKTGARFGTHLYSIVSKRMLNDLPRVLSGLMHVDQQHQRDRDNLRMRLTRAGKSSEEIRAALNEHRDAHKKELLAARGMLATEAEEKQWAAAPEVPQDYIRMTSEHYGPEAVEHNIKQLKKRFGEGVFAQLKREQQKRQELFREHPFIKDAYEKHFGLSVAKSWLYAVDLLKAVGDEVAATTNAAQYRWRSGEPGAHKYMYETPEGEVQQMTNAPEDHEHHDPEAGSPELSPNEPNPDEHPQIFDNFGRKLHQPKPDEAETEPNLHYHPEQSSWSEKYTDDSTGMEHKLHLHRDRLNDERFSFNEDIRHVDAQLEKVRKWYSKLLSSKKLQDQAVGLMAALVDQAKMVTGNEGAGIADLKISNIMKRGNVYQFSLLDNHGGKHVVSALLDGPTASVLHTLAEGKKPSDYLFEAEGQRIGQLTFARLMHEKFGVSPKQFRVYHATELFSKEFQKLAAKKGDLSTEQLHDLYNQALIKVAQQMGHLTNDPKSLTEQLAIDPVVTEALFMSVIHHHNSEINKSLEKAYKLQGKILFQGLPISIENKKGSTRHWYDVHEKRYGETKMQHDYGYIRGTKGTDNDHVDVYVGPHKDAKNVFVIHQNKAPDFKVFDEDKCLVGFLSGKEAKAAYLKQYDNPKFFGGMTILSMDEFKQKVFKTKNNPQMIKSITGKKGGPTVWHVTANPQKRSPDEKTFGEWVHTHPMDEHKDHWMAFKHATRVADAPMAQTDREYAADISQLPEIIAKQEKQEAGNIEEESVPTEAGNTEEESVPTEAGNTEEESVPTEAGNTEEEVAKSLIDQMIAVAA